MKSISLTRIQLFGDVKISINPDHISSIEPEEGDTLVSLYNGRNYTVSETEEEIRKLIADCEAKPAPPAAPTIPLA